MNFLRTPVTAEKQRGRIAGRCHISDKHNTRERLGTLMDSLNPRNARR